MVLCVKVDLKKSNPIKKFLGDNDLFNRDYRFSKNCCSIYFPINNTEDQLKSKLKETFKDVTIEFQEMDLEKTDKITNLRDALKEDLNKEEQEILKTAFDTVGSIAIMDIPPGLIKKEKLIANKLLEINKNLTTVLKKKGIHGTEFRTQEMEYLAGENTKEAVYKELSTTLTLDVEKVYFSPRLSTDRKRIIEMVKPGEEILVMFSGCAPYPCTFGKNTKARHITGIELNPVGHKYGMINIKQNKLHNVTLINGDVHNVVPKIYNHLVGLKSSYRQEELKSRLALNPTIIEFYLFDEDLYENKQELEDAIQEVQEKNIQVVIHMPMGYKDKEGLHKSYSLGQFDITKEREMFEILGKICKKYNIKAIIHATHNSSIVEDEGLIVAHIKLFKQYYDYFYFENLTHGLIANTDSFVRIAKKSNIKNVCIDIAHLYIIYKDNDKIENHIKEVQKYFNTYFHLGDHDCKTHTCRIGEGNIDFDKVMPYVNAGVIEIEDKDYLIPSNMINSYLDIVSDTKKFDRILMPLPKSAEYFLDDALQVSKSGTIIHFYDFLHEDNFKEAHEKISNACKARNMNHKILNTVKCGQHAPKVFRICVDVQIL